MICTPGPGVLGQERVDGHMCLRIIEPGGTGDDHDRPNSYSQWANDERCLARVERVVLERQSPCF